MLPIRVQLRVQTASFDVAFQAILGWPVANQPAVRKQAALVFLGVLVSIKINSRL